MTVIPSREPGTSGALRVCTKTVMDSSDPDITWDADGVCNWWHEFHAIKAQLPGPDASLKPPSR